MLAIPAAATHGTTPLLTFLIILSVLTVLFWKAALKIVLIILLLLLLITITSGTVYLLPVLQHVIK
jgi:hypothetical protein